MTYCEQLDILDAATQDAELVGLLSPVAAVTFGVIPIERRDGTVRVACGHTWHPGCRPLVERALGASIDTLTFRDGVIKQYLLDAYLGEGTVNHNTFPSPDFAEDEASFKLLTENKIEDIGEVRTDLPADKLVLLDITYRSVLDNLDGGKGKGELLCGPLDVPFRVLDDGRATVAEKVEDDVTIVLRRDFFYDALEHSGEDSFHGVQALHLSELPYMIHPSEIQITQVAEDGALTLYIYDHTETVSPGQTQQWVLEYYFMSLGNRHSRELSLRINGLHVVDRDSVTVAGTDVGWGVSDLERWLRLNEDGRM